MQLYVFVLSGERGGQVEFFVKDPLIFRHFPQEVRDQGRVWGLVEHFYKDLLFFGCGFLLVLCK